MAIYASSCSFHARSAKGLGRPLWIDASYARGITQSTDSLSHFTSISQSATTLDGVFIKPRPSARQQELIYVTRSVLPNKVISTSAFAGNRRPFWRGARQFCPDVCLSAGGRRLCRTACYCSVVGLSCNEGRP